MSDFLESQRLTKSVGDFCAALLLVELFASASNAILSFAESDVIVCANDLSDASKII